MHRWLTASAQAASHVADRSNLWPTGALAWMVTVGWLALIVGVASPPTDAELTFFGAGANPRTHGQLALWFGHAAHERGAVAPARFHRIAR